jgi:hypothetical protein
VIPEQIKLLVDRYRLAPASINWAGEIHIDHGNCGLKSSVASEFTDHLYMLRILVERVCR